jgi:8-oxo-dGTP diphosphatase
LLLKRSSEKDYGAEGWECVTGRLEQGESFETALHREVMEELGIGIQPDFIASTGHFHRGAPVPDNELLSVLYCCTTNEPDAITVSAEHDEARWVTAAEAFTFIPHNNWLYQLLQRAEIIYAKIPDDLRDFYRQNGYETR